MLPTATPEIAFADDATFNVKIPTQRISPGSVIIAGSSFGRGPSREKAVSCLGGPELVIEARSFTRSFVQNGINVGLRIVTCPTIDTQERDALEITKPQVVSKTAGRTFPVVPTPGPSRRLLTLTG